MRSTKGNATRFLLKRNLFIGVIVFLVAFYMMPFWGLSHVPHAGQLAKQPYAAEMAADITKSVSVQVMTSPLNLEMMVILYGGLGFMTAMMLMRHLFSRRQSMLYAALPDRRETDFLRRCVGYVALCLAPIVINFLLYLLVVAANGLLGYVALDRLLPKFGRLLLINFYGFAVGMLCSVLTGTWWAAILAGAVLIVGAEGLAMMWHSIAGQYLHTLVQSTLVDRLARLSPAYALYKSFYRPAQYSILPGAAAAVLALALSFLLYRVRKTERAERTLAFEQLQPVLGVVLSMMGGTFLGMAFMLSFTTEISLIVGMILGAALTFWVCQIVFAQRLCGILRQWALPAASAAVLVLGWAVLYTDALGYDRFLPERGKLAAISYAPTGYETGDRITLTSEEALDAAYTWCTLMRDEVNSYDRAVDASSLYSGSDVVVTFQLGDRKVYRHYPNNAIRTQAQDSLKRMIESDDYRQSLIARYHLESKDISTLYCYNQNEAMQEDAFYEQFGASALNRGMSRQEDGMLMDLLIEALKADILNRTFEEKQQTALLSLEFNIDLPDGGMQYLEAKVYPGDTNVLRAIYGEKMEEVVRYASGGYADSEDIVVLKVDYTETVGDLRNSYADLREKVESVELAETPEEAKAWIRESQGSTANRYYYMPCQEDEMLSRLHIYRLSTVEKYANAYGYKVPEDKTKLYDEPMIPTMMTLDYIGEN
ncbi:MAG: hypothetical protein ACI4O4_11655 [Candidatus Ventricola sp.]